jgi:hypothetical protein
VNISERSQRAILWWGITFAVIYGIAFIFLMQFVPPPDATMAAPEVAEWYSERHDEIRIGAMIASWTGAFFLPIFAVLTIQVARVEQGRKIWTVLTAMGGAMMSIFLVLPPLFWGVAAYTDGRVDSEVTTLMHELGTLTLVTTDQYYIFAFVALVVISFIPTDVAHSPFTRWYGYFTAWAAFMFEAGAIAFIPRTGPFAWDGLLVFWSPLTIVSLWIAVTSYQVFKAIRAQRAAAAPDGREMVSEGGDTKKSEYVAVPQA